MDAFWQKQSHDGKTLSGVQQCVFGVRVHYVYSGQLSQSLMLRVRPTVSGRVISGFDYQEHSQVLSTIRPYIQALCFNLELFPASDTIALHSVHAPSFHSLLVLGSNFEPKGAKFQKPSTVEQTSTSGINRLGNVSYRWTIPGLSCRFRPYISLCHYFIYQYSA